MLGLAVVTVYDMTARDVARARKTVEHWERVWATYHNRIVTDAEIREAEHGLSQASEELRRLRSPAYAFRHLKLFLLRATSTMPAGSELLAAGWLLTSLLLATPGVAFAALILVLLSGNSLALVIFGCMGAYLFLASALALVLYTPSSRSLEQERDGLRAELAQRAENLTLFSERLEGWRKHHRSLLRLREAQDEYDRACQHYEKMKRVLDSRRYRLIHTNWQSLRGVPFEDFLADVFEELGYSVETTKTSGDQGVDLVVTGKGRRIAVQAKGYTGSVGNKAVQEVYAGMKFYRCDKCVVVTNSAFTSGAVSLAKSVHCLLIDQYRIADFIQGKVL
jgi:hypothetical protein